MGSISGLERLGWLRWHWLGGRHEPGSPLRGYLVGAQHQADQSLEVDRRLPGLAAHGMVATPCILQDHFHGVLARAAFGHGYRVSQSGRGWPSPRMRPRVSRKRPLSPGLMRAISRQAASMGMTLQFVTVLARMSWVSD